MSRVLKKSIMDLFLPVDEEIILSPTCIDGAPTSAAKLWNEFVPEYVNLNRSLRKSVEPVIDQISGLITINNQQVIAETKRLLNTKEVAALIGKSAGSVRNLVCQGRLTPASKKWNTNYFDKDIVIKSILASDEGDK